MGNLFSKKKSLKDSLIDLENKVLKEEYEISDLSISAYPKGLIFLFAFPFLFYFLNLSLLFSCIASFILLFIYIFVFRKYKQFRIKQKTVYLDRLKEERKKLIERCKNDVSFSVTKQLIEKYEEEENRNTFFKQILKKRKSPMESVSDFVLGNDPANLNALICVNCGVHNGLVDPKNDEYAVYYCYNCKHKNIRDIKKRDLK